MSLTGVQAECFKGALALNNLGCGLLQQRSPKQAIRTLKDSVASMKLVFGSEGECAASLPLVEAKVHRATVLFSNNESNLPYDRADASSGNDVRSLPFIDGQENLNSRITTSPSGTSQPRPGFCMTPIFIDDDGHIDTDVCSAIVLFNFGVAHLVGSEMMPRSPESLLQNALKVFHLAYSLLCTKTAELTGFEDSILQQEILSLSTKMLSNLVCILLELDMTSEAQDCYGQLSALKEATALTDLASLVSTNAAPAA